jgi:hypothetical protein
MNPRSSRRAFLAEVGRGMLIASIGTGSAMELGLAAMPTDDGSAAASASSRLSFGVREPLVALMQDTPIDKLLERVVAQLSAGTPLRELVAAAALANARTFGGEDYIGFHTMMALAPALHMSRELGGERAALPVLKVLYRNTQRIAETGGRLTEVLHPVEIDATLTAKDCSGEALRAAVRAGDVEKAERIFAILAKDGSGTEALEKLLVAVEDHTEVHRVVLPYRAWDLLGIIGSEEAHTLLRQSVRYCVKNQKHNPGKAAPLLEKLLDRWSLLDRPLGAKTLDDARITELSETILRSDREQAADLVASILAEGVSPGAVGELLAISANQLVLRDDGRPEKWASDVKPVGSVHGDSIGVHSCDAVNAWRNLARVGESRNTASSLILAAWEASGKHVGEGVTDFAKARPRPSEEALAKVRGKDPEALLEEAAGAIREKDQERAAAIIHRYGELGLPPRPVFDLLLRFAVSEDGALHAEKYYRTVSEEFASIRPSFRWRQLTALARVSASAYGRPAPGLEEAEKLVTS